MMKNKYPPEEKSADHFVYQAMTLTIANSNGDAQKMKNYAAKVCNIGQTERLKLDEEVEKLPKFKKQVKATVVKAENLLAKDANCLSDPYCILSINGRKKIVKTNTIYKTLNPEWNEEFLIDLHEKDIVKGDLKLEIWDEDPKELCKVLSEVRNLKWGGIRHFIRDVGETIFASCCSVNTDDFIGKASVPLKKLSYEPQKMELKLAGKGKKIEPERGTLFLTLQLQCKIWTSHDDLIQQHLLLHRVCSECSSYKTTLEYRTLLEEHAGQNGINKIEQTICRCIASLKDKRNNDSKDLQKYEEYYENLAELRNLMTQNGEDYHLCYFLKEMLTEALQKFIDTSAKTIKNDLDEHLKSNNVGFQNLLKCLYLVREIKNNRIILPEIHEAIVEEAKLWFERIFSEHKEQLEQMSTATQTLQDIFKLFYKRLRKANEEFETYADFPYVIFVYKELDGALMGNFKPIVERCCLWSLESQNMEVQISLLPVYLWLKLLWSYIKPMKKEKEQLHLGYYSDWFPEELMECWFDMQTPVITKYIEAAVVDRSLEEPFRKITTHLSNFHKMLEWPRNTSIVSLFRILCSAVKTFAEKISDIYNVYERAEAKDIEVSLGAYCQAMRLLKETQNYIIHYARSEVLNMVGQSICNEKIYHLTKDTEKHTERIRKQINNGCIASVISDTMNEPIQQIGACKDQGNSKKLLQKMSGNLRGLIDYVSKNLDNYDFIAVLEYLWTNMLTLIEQQVDAICHQNSKAFNLFKSDVPYIGMLNLIEELVSVFKANTNKTGLEESQMELERVNKIKEKLAKRTKVEKPQRQETRAKPTQQLTQLTYEEPRTLPQHDPTRKSWASMMASMVVQNFFSEPDHKEEIKHAQEDLSKKTAEEEQKSLSEQEPPRKSWASRMASLVAQSFFPALQERVNQQEELDTSIIPAVKGQRPLPVEEPPRAYKETPGTSRETAEEEQIPHLKEPLRASKETPGTSKETAEEEQIPLPEDEPPRKSWASTMASMVAQSFFPGRKS